MKNKKIIALLLAAVLLLTLTACGKAAPEAAQTVPQETQAAPAQPTAESEQSNTRTVVDGAGREVEIPANVERIVCLNVGALRYTCYMGAQNLVVGVEDYEQKPTMSRLYNYVNFDFFASLPVIGTNGEHFPEAIIEADPDVIIMAAFDDQDADDLTAKTGIPVVVVPSSDTMMDDRAYDTFRIMGEVYGMEDRARELCSYMDSIKADLDSRTADTAEVDKPSVYVGCVSFKGQHGLEGTEAGYGPLAAIRAKNLADTTDQKGAFNIDMEQILQWDPDVMFVDFNGIPLMNEDYAANPDFYNSLTAVQEGRVYSQISFRSSASNLETALADTYYCASILYPEQFADVDPAAKADEIFEMLLGEKLYDDLEEAGYAFRPIKIGE